tara:strand:+ start:2108 stop:2302 length:195 start_codon:yes stop_codon:yes gene_type:complete
VVIFRQWQIQVLYPKDPLVGENIYPFFVLIYRVKACLEKENWRSAVFKSGKLDIDEIKTWKPGK